MSHPKVFGIGFHKTGTTSLKLALRRLGYRVGGKLGVHHPQIARQARELAFRQLERHDAFQDNPWPLLYRELDERCPGSRFVLTVRPTEKWIASVVRHFGRSDTPMREWIYSVGHPLGNEEIYVRRYEAHNAAVREYFQGRPQDLLVFRTGEGDGWPELCGFLGRPIPAGEFPHANSWTLREAKQGFARTVRRGVRRPLRSIGAELTRRLTWTASPLGRWW